MRRWVSVRNDFHNARRRFLSSTDLIAEERTLIRKVSLRVHPADAMYEGDAFHYLSVGLSASRGIRQALRCTPECTIRSVLDFPSGYGRVLRFLPMMFPNSEITAAEVNNTALKFCRRRFSVATLRSQITLSELSIPQRFDVIWCGSLFTHIDEGTTRDLLKFFHDHLSNRGVCVFSTHGNRSIECIRTKEFTYGLSEDARQEVLRGFQLTGYGYADYPNRSGCGISAVSHSKMVDLARGVGRWEETFFAERAWDNHHDVYAFAMPTVHG